MEFKSRIELKQYLKTLLEIGYGSQGVAYKDRNGQVLKIYHDFFDNTKTNIEEEKVLRFKNIKTETFYFPIDVVTLSGAVVGEITTFAPGKLLCETDPLEVKYDGLITGLDQVRKDIKTISTAGIRIFDSCYNTMYKDGKYFAIDTTEYGKGTISGKEDIQRLTRINNSAFSYEIKDFVTAGFLEGYVFSHPTLRELYNSKNIDIKKFLIELKKALSEDIGKELIYLKDARELFNGSVKLSQYKRIIK